MWRCGYSNVGKILTKFVARAYGCDVKLLLEAFNSSRSTATVTFSTLDIPRRHMAHQTRCIANVITTLIFPTFQSNANKITR